MSARRWPLPLLAFVALLLLCGCEEAPSTLEPKSDDARAIAFAFWILVGAGTLTFVIVAALLLIALFRPRDAQFEPGRSDPVKALLVSGAVVPLVVMAGVMALTLRTMTDVTDEDGEPELVIQIVGHQWFWEVRYPNGERDGTPNQVVIPQGRLVRFEITSADVMHAFWIPQLNGKIDAIPGRTTSLELVADEVGEYRGKCAEFCGLRHARMGFTVRVVTQEEFAGEGADPGASPSPEGSVSPTPSPSTSPTPSPSPPPSPSPSPEATPTATASPTATPTIPIRIP